MTATDMTKAPPTGSLPEKKTLKKVLEEVDVKARFKEIMGERAGAFMSNLLSVSQANQALQDAAPGSIIAAGMKAALLDLPIEPSLGFASIVPFDGVASFQIQWKGYVQMAHRTNQYAHIHLARVYEGQLVEWSELRGRGKFNEKAKKSERVIGHFFTFTLKGGEPYEFYWPVQKSMQHGKRYSPAFWSKGGKWLDDPTLPKAKDGRVEVEKIETVTEGSGSDAMCAKTVVKMSLSKWGPLSTQMVQAVASDGQVFNERGEGRFVEAELAADLENGKHKEEGGGKKQEMPKAKGADQGKPKAEDAGETAEFFVAAVGEADLEGEPCFSLRDTSDPVVKYFFDSESVFNLAKAARDSKTRVIGKWSERKVDKTKVRWLTALDPKKA